MAMSPLSARPGAPGSEARRARIVVALVVIGISASLLAYAISPGVRHAVSHAAHSVKHAVSRVFDRDAGSKPKAKTGSQGVQSATGSRTAAPAGAGRTTTSAHSTGAGVSSTAGAAAP